MTGGDRVRLYTRLPITADVEWWSAQVEASRDGRVLYLGCGTGRLAVPLARTASRLVAVDDDSAMLAAFRRRLAEADDDVAARVVLVHDDAARLDLDGDFDLIVLPAGLLNDIADGRRRVRTLQCARAHCVRSGRIVLEVLNPYWLAAADTRSQGTITGRDGRVAVEVTIEPGTFDAWSQRRRTRLRYRFPDGERLADDLDATALFPGDLRRLVRRSELEIVARWGADPGRSDLDATTPTWHLVCRPAQEGPPDGGS